VLCGATLNIPGWERSEGEGLEASLICEAHDEAELDTFEGLAEVWGDRGVARAYSDFNGTQFSDVWVARSTGGIIMTLALRTTLDRLLVVGADSFGPAVTDLDPTERYAQVPAGLERVSTVGLAPEAQFAASVTQRRVQSFQWSAGHHLVQDSVIFSFADGSTSEVFCPEEHFTRLRTLVVRRRG
jgi:hypothetical protein